MTGKIIRCCWNGCWRKTAQPFTDHWAHLSKWDHGIKDGFYCPAYAAAIEKVLEEGGYLPAAAITRRAPA
jgi:hypothetical protein